MTNFFVEPTSWAPDSIHLEPVQAQLLILNNVRNCFLHGWPEGTLYEGAEAHYICWEIGRTLDEFQRRGHTSATRDAGRALKGYILDRLDSNLSDNQSLGGWLYEKGVIRLEQCVGGNPMLHLARLAWLDRMILELEQHGRLP